MKIKIILAIILASILGHSNAQNVQINDVKNRFYSGVHSIEDLGYFTIYQSEKLKKGMVSYNLEIFDLDLKQIALTPIEASKSAVFLGAEFNGQNFLFAFADYKKKTNLFMSFDQKGKLIKQLELPIQKTAALGTTQLFPARDGSGFYVTSTVKEKKWGFKIQKFDTDLKVLWDRTTVRDKGWVGLMSAESSHGRLVILSMEKPAITSKKIYGNIVGIDDKTGENLYEYPLYNGTITASPSSLLIEEDGSVVTCGMYFDGEKWDATNSDGIFFLKLGPTGEKEAFNSVDWENGIQETLKATQRKFSIGSKPKLIFHEIIKDVNGGYQLIGETFRKTVKAGTIIAAMSNSNQPPPMGFTVMDYVIFNYDATGTPVDINKIEKPYKSITVDGNIANLGGIALANYMKKFKMFTYEFTAKVPSTDQQVIVFTNFEDGTLGKGDPYLGISTITPGEDSRTRKIPLLKKFTSFVSGGDLMSGALEGKPGSLCVYLYDRKAQTISLSLEPLSID